ncbi:MAG: hypothetical protein JRK53_06600 [Deltaproteobacteria bacterium]|nr:hypothetical protein [Deltaproteobacteria bacterium]MBW1817655.1 hypothetical protein [Deltaproteobacteria bacterium]MBW2284452.1 hypothetical protein [Deltaproteobacteria bacterium]
MPSLQIRDLPEPLYRKLQEEARKERRSFSQQAVVTLARGLGIPTSRKERRRDLIEKIRLNPVIKHGGDFPDPAALIREDRER